MKILIPMAGMGKRFLRAGYTTPKPLIEADGIPVIEHIVRNFSGADEFVFGVNEDHLKSTSLEALLKRLVPSSVIVAMPYQEEGPIAVVEKMLEGSPVREDEPVIVNYCDFSWVWNYGDFKREMAADACDGAVVCYRGFHPHLLGPNLYATLDADGLWMKEIREKYSWHPNKQDDWTSSGTYYFKTGHAVKKYFGKIRKCPERKIHGEYYVSQIFQLMKEDGLKIRIYEIPFMLQWGTPEDLESYGYWSDYFRKKQSLQDGGVRQEMTVLILMAGAGKRFSEEGYHAPKPFIPVEGIPMVIQAARELPSGNRYIFVTRDFGYGKEFEEEIREVFPDPGILTITGLTEGQACTALCAKHLLDPEKPLLIGACDHSVLFDPKQFESLTRPDSGVDALIFTYRGNPVVRHKPQMYGWVETDSANRVLRVSVKVPLEGDPVSRHAVVGAFWFRKAKYFTDQAEAMIEADRRINREFYIDECMNGLVAKNLQVYVFEVERYASWGSPDELRTYEYWQRFFAQAPFHPYPKEKILR